MFFFCVCRQYKPDPFKKSQCDQGTAATKRQTKTTVTPGDGKLIDHIHSTPQYQDKTIMKTQEER